MNTEGHGFCFACELQFGTGYPELGVPVPSGIVYLISYLKFNRKTVTFLKSIDFQTFLVVFEIEGM